MDDFPEGTRFALITFTDQVHLERYHRRVDLPFPVLRDPDRTTYRAYSLGRATRRRVWSPAVIRRYVQLFRQGERDLQRPTEDVLQLGGDFVIAADGTLAYTFRSKGPDDRPAVDELIEAAQSAIGAR
ncbi:MAG TPA: hypothetical protein ENI86_14290 [Acidimicrobiales bacterium]|nr:hypothetical protein [Acidimicrobiales bacterium]